MNGRHADVHNGVLKPVAYLAILAVFVISGYAAWGVVRERVLAMPDPFAAAVQEDFNRYVTGEIDHAFHAEDAGFRGVFPGAPRKSEEPLPIGSTTATIVSYDVPMSFSVSFSIAYLDLPADTTVDLAPALRGVARDLDGHVEWSQPVTHAGHDAVEGLVRTDRLFVRLRLVQTPERLYLAQVTNIADPLEAYNRFVSKLTLEQPAA